MNRNDEIFLHYKAIQINKLRKEKHIIKLPKDIYTNKEILEEIGFHFKNIIDESNFYEVTIPNGWRLKANFSVPWIDLYDHNNLHRAIYFYKSLSCKKPYIMLKNRYDIYITVKDKYNEIVEVYFGEENGEKLFISGECYNDESEIKILTQNAIRYANENYPEWNNVKSYWNNEKQKTLKL